MTYRPSLLRRFVETPKLEWREKIVFIDHDKKERWVFEHNMYSVNPASNTLRVWSSRYFLAYDHARGISSTIRGSSRLFDKNGNPVPWGDLPKLKKDTKDDKTRSVQKYLKENGGTLFIEIDDRPNVAITKGGRNVERLVLFTCGSMGGGPKFIAIQHLRTFKDLPKNRWVRAMGRGFRQTDIPLPQGYRDVVVPTSVSKITPPGRWPGEVL
jgi:hypothetical protein